VNPQLTLRVRTARASIASLLLLLAALSGCASGGKTDGPSEARRLAFQEQLSLTTSSIQAADLDQAKVHASEARNHAWGATQLEKVTSLDYLISGAEALQYGDAALTQVEWSQITDPALRREVSDKARAIGIDVSPGHATQGKDRRP
jgi:hypothetical protein